jgi:dihydroorotate dehydrogenase (NAD+) catalytic subunit
MKPADIAVTVAGVPFANPIILSSGILSSSRNGLLRAQKRGVGGVITKSATSEPCLGNPRPVTVMGPGYVINADGIRNQGYRAMAADIREAKQEGLRIPVIASIAGASIEQFQAMAAEFEKQGADAVELNFVCPNRGKMVGGGAEECLGRYWSDSAERSYAVVRATKEAVTIPVWVKYPFETVYRDRRVPLKIEEAGADVHTVMTTMPRAMAIDLETGRPVLGNPRGAGAIGGSVMKPLGIHCVSELTRVVRSPVVATGGAFSGLDIIEYLMVGAQAVEVLTAIMHKVSVDGMIAEIEDYMFVRGYGSLSDFRGRTLGFLPALE